VRNPVHKACFALMYACGLRISEAATLEVGAIDLRESHISFHFPTHANGVEAGQAESYGLWACGFVSVAFVSIPSA